MQWAEQLHPRNPSGGAGGGRFRSKLGDKLRSEWASAPWSWRDDEARFSQEPPHPARPEWERDLTPGETAALKHYTGGGYRALNERLQAGEQLGADDRGRDLTELAELLDSAIGKAGTHEQPVTVWRGVALHGGPDIGPTFDLTREQREARMMEGVADWAEATFRPGALFEPSGYQSTSFSVGPALNAAVGKKDPGLIFEIQAYSGALLDGERLTVFDDEAELLQGRHTRYEVVAVLRRVEFEQDGDGDPVWRTVVKLREVRPDA